MKLILKNIHIKIHLSFHNKIKKNIYKLAYKKVSFKGTPGIGSRDITHPVPIFILFRFLSRTNSLQL